MAHISKMETTQTAVQWLYDELTKTWYDKKSSQDLLEQAKQMEKEQIKLFYEDLIKNIGTIITKSEPSEFEEYYNENYNK